MAIHQFSYAVVRLPVGTVAALLTSCEYLLSTIAALSARAAVHGSWLYNLHRGGEASISVAARMKRNIRKDIIGSIIGVWLVISVALVESNLYASVIVSRSLVVSPSCVSTSHPFDVGLFEDLIPSMRAVVEPWVVGVVDTLNCQGGLATIGGGAGTDIYGKKKNMSAPVCDQSVVIPPEQISIRLSRLHISSKQIVFRPTETAIFEIIPYSTKGIGSAVPRLGPDYEGQGPCGAKGISTYLAGLRHGWITLYANAHNVSVSVMESVCEQHLAPVAPISFDLADRCSNLKSKEIDLSCIYTQTSQDDVYSAVIRDTSAIFVGKSSLDPSFACLNASIRIDYLFLPAKIFTQMSPPIAVTMPVLVPVKVAAVSGYCERTVHVLGRAALVYSADAEWLHSELRELDRRTRYHAFMIAVSSSQFPLANILNSLPEASVSSAAKIDEPCLLRGVSEVTLVPWNWCLWLLILGVSVSCIFMVVGLALRLFFAGESWRVGSAQWSLTRLFNDTGLADPFAENSVFVQVVHEEDGSPSRSDAESVRPRSRASSRHFHTMTDERESRRSRSRSQSLLRETGRQYRLSGKSNLLTLVTPREKRVQYQVRTTNRNVSGNVSQSEAHSNESGTRERERNEQQSYDEVTVVESAGPSNNMSIVRLRSKTGGSGSGSGVE